MADDIIIIVDYDTFCKYADSFEEFRPFNFQYIFLSVEKLPMNRLLNFSSTGALTNYNNVQLSKIIEEKKITTIVSVELFSSLSVQASRLSSKFSIDHIVIVWENIKRSLFYYVPPFSFNTKIVKAAARKIIAVSDASKQAAISLRISEDKIDTIYPGIFVDKFRLSMDSVDKILFVGNLERSKGVHILLKVLEGLSRDFDAINLILVGQGSLESKIIKMKNSGLKILYHGYVPHSKLTSIYSDSSIFCLPSIKVKKAGLITTLQEQFGFTLVEAMASGLPIVSSNIGSVPEIVGKDNLTVAPTVDNILGALCKLLTSDELRKGLRKKNRDRCISRFNALTQSIKFGREISS